MPTFDVNPLDTDLTFGARVSGLTLGALHDGHVIAELRAIFEDRGMILFEDMEPTSQTHVAVSNVFGPLKEHPVSTVGRVDGEMLPGVISIGSDPLDASVIELEGKYLAQWLPWHFDHCYNDKLNRGGVLRATEIARTGGLTGFADGVQLYEDFAPELREQIEGRNIIYTLNLVLSNMRFGRPEGFRVISNKKKAVETTERAKSMPRALHPAVWKRSDGRKVLHLSPWMSEGIEGAEDAEGEALLEAACQEVNRRVKPYFHRWNLTDMIIWDNWRMLHCVTGCAPSESRRMHRTTIAGDYGLGYFENKASGARLLSETQV